MSKLERGAPLIAFALAVSCAGEGPSAPMVYTARFVAANDLIAPITILIDGVPNVILHHGVSATISASTRSHVTWTSAKPADAAGHLIPDEIGEIEIPISGVNEVFEITNIIHDQPYFTASVFNFTNRTVSIGVFDGETVACAGVLPAASIRAGFVQTGYYRVTPRTELRAYLNPAGCIGTFVAWPPSEIGGYAPKSGLLQVALTAE